MTGRFGTWACCGYRWGPALAWMILIFLLSSRPLPAAAARAPDWLMHAGAYAVLAALLFHAVAVQGWFGPLSPARWGAVFLAASLYGVADEIHQSFVPGRCPQAADAVADSAGAAGALAAIGVLRRRGRAAATAPRLTPPPETLQ